MEVAMEQSPVALDVDVRSDAAPEADGGGAPARRPGLAGAALARVLAYIDGHLGDAMGLPELAAVARMSRFHFARRFRQSTGESPMRYVLRRRIEWAMPMLADPARSVAAIALELGFFDQSHFTRSFRRLAGMTPRDYRRMCLKRRRPARRSASAYKPGGGANADSASSRPPDAPPLVPAPPRAAS
ncbi:helix-turn-helix transcriptional regulator [Coralloluteibacterium stylophorae]|uniref:Helix-turn-helix transcriptional regulator n=2 Tax=Coralloluteibacterium stylophorae TaxID=1776034 RepID=A0AAP2CC73_9GAMM|nr:AraC family transcriptional regulator [Coralloluteibacterium stylophorae]MBS7458113.1 helix-turn-helix transcriptional regulator [Coralloluteibacterium stylophorae]